MDLFDDVIWPLFITALAITAIVCFTKLYWHSLEAKRRERAARLAAYDAAVQQQWAEMRAGRGGY